MANVASLFEELTVLQRTVARRVAESLADDGLTIDQWRLLRCLTSGSGRRVGELAAEVVLPLPSMTRLVDGLAELGLVYRRPADDDRRSVELHLSRQGRVRLMRADALVEERLDGLLDDPAFAPLRHLVDVVSER